MKEATPYPGIDYSGLGSTANRNPETGIRYGVISQHSVHPDFWDGVEYDYGEAQCPNCEKKLTEVEREDEECYDCGKSFNSEDCYPEEPRGWSYDKEGYKLTGCLDTDIFVSESKFYTYAKFCSPCVPGAGNLDNPFEHATPIEDNYPAWGEDYRIMAEACGFPKTYCLNHDWFEDGKAPYPVFSVETNELIKPES